MLIVLCTTCSFREDRGDQILDYKQEIQTMEEQLKKLQKEVQTHEPSVTQKHLKHL